jgi:hypothetical protein
MKHQTSFQSLVVSGWCQSFIFESAHTRLSHPDGWLLPWWSGAWELPCNSSEERILFDGALYHVSSRKDIAGNSLTPRIPWNSCSTLHKLQVVADHLGLHFSTSSVVVLKQASLIRE